MFEHVSPCRLLQPGANVIISGLVLADELSVGIVKRYEIEQKTRLAITIKLLLRTNTGAFNSLQFLNWRRTIETSETMGSLSLDGFPTTVHINDEVLRHLSMILSRLAFTLQRVPSSLSARRDRDEVRVW